MSAVLIAGPAFRLEGFVVPKGGLEPPQVSPYAPQAHVSTNSTTSAMNIIYQMDLYCQHPGKTESMLTAKVISSPFPLHVTWYAAPEFISGVTVYGLGKTARKDLTLLPPGHF